MFLVSYKKLLTCIMIKCVFSKFNLIKTYSFIANRRYNSCKLCHLLSFNKNRLSSMVPSNKIIVIFTIIFSLKMLLIFAYHFFSKCSLPSTILVSGIANDLSLSKFRHFLGLIQPVVLELERTPKI